MSDTIRWNTMCPPGLWVCPRCDTRVRTHINTYPVECRHKSHHKDSVMMVLNKEEE
jgi:hypothetical protein